MTDEQASQLNDLFRALVLPLPGNTDPNGTEMGVNWTTVYGYRVGQSLQQMVAELGDRLGAIEDELGISARRHRSCTSCSAPSSPPSSCS